MEAEAFAFINDGVEGEDEDDREDRAGGDEDSESVDYEFENCLDAASLLQLNNNDPALTELNVRFGRYQFANRVDWKSENYFDGIGNNTHLKTLYLYYDNDGDYEYEDADSDDDSPTIDEISQAIGDFCRYLATNRSIEHLSYTCPFEMEPLTVFIENNDNLRHLVITEFITDSSLILASSLSNRKNKSSLESVSFRNILCEMSCEFLSELIASLGGYHNLVQLDLSGSCLGREASIALRRLIKQPNMKLEELNLSNIPIHNECAAILADGFAKSKTLKKLNFSGQDSVVGFGLGVEGIIALADVLANSVTIKSVDLRNNHLVTSIGWCRFFHRLRNSETVVEELNLGGNTITYEGAAALTAAFSNSDKLNTLILPVDQLNSTRGWQAVADLLLPSCFSALEVLEVQCNYDEVRAITTFANALVNNTSLKTLLMDHGQEGMSPTTERALAVMANTLCNTSSINATYASNHTLETFSYSPHNSDIASALLLNKNKNKLEVAHHKILNHHFMQTEGVANLNVFIDMDLKVLPHAIAWVGMCRDSMGLSVLHKILSSLPPLLKSEKKVRFEVKMRPLHKKPKL